MKVRWNDALKTWAKVVRIGVGLWEVQGQIREKKKKKLGNIFSDNCFLNHIGVIVTAPKILFYM